MNFQEMSLAEFNFFLMKCHQYTPNQTDKILLKINNLRSWHNSLRANALSAILRSE